MDIHAQLDLVRALAILFCGLVLVPSGAHALELTNKMTMPAGAYMIAQRSYRGWASVGLFVVAALLCTGGLSLALRGQAPSFGPALFAFLCLVAAQLVFWLFTYPMNVRTHNWTSVPKDFEAVRRQWEYSHAAAAVLSLSAFVAVILAAM
jgi:amino acid permease